MSLRIYQQSAVDSAITWAKYKDTPAIIVLPTGAGKSHVIAALAEHYYKLGERVCILAHRKELLAQNGGKMSIPHGYCSASLGDKDLHLPVIVGGIQTIARRELQPFDKIIIDECHRVPNNDELGQYWQFIAQNEGCRVIGLTATPYRLSGGKLKWGEIIYQAHYADLRDVGYLSPLVNKLKNQPDLSAVKITAGDYNESELSSCMESPELVDSAIKHLIAYGAERKCGLVFCVSIKHSEIMLLAMLANGLSASIIHGNMSDDERDKTIELFKRGEVKYLINCMILLEGFDHPPIDLILCLRPTKSKALWEQMLGRGVRIHDGKTDCLLLDMAGNLKEHGGMGTPYHEPSRKEGKKEHGRICPSCEEFVQPVTAKSCNECGYVFLQEEPSLVSHNLYADTESEVVRQPIQEYEVVAVTYGEHMNRKKGTRSIKVTYYTNYEPISEWIAPWSDSGWARNKAWQFFKERGKDIYTTQEKDISSYSADDLLFYCERLRKPIKIWVDTNEKFPRITRYEYEQQSTEASGGGNSAGVNPLDEDFIPF